MKYLLYLFPVIVLCLLIGCGNLSTVSGTVTFEDGSPLTVGTVVFQSPTFVAKEVLNSSGRYSLKVVPGEYTVYISSASVLDETFVPPPDEPDAVRHIPLIDSQFASLSESQLKCTVTGSQKFDIFVTKPAN